MMDLNYPNDSTSTVGSPRLAQIGYVISQDSGKEKEHKSFLTHIVKISLFIVLIGACRFSNEDDLQRELPQANISRSVVKQPFPPSRPSSVLKNKPEQTAEEMLEKLSRKHRIKNTIQSKDKDKRQQRMLSAIPKVYDGVDEPYEEKVQYSLSKCSCEDCNVEIDGDQWEPYHHHSKNSKFVFINDLLILVIVGIIVGAITCAAIGTWVAVFPLIILIPVVIKIIDVLNGR
ncbi:Uncharacterized protein PCOAH_00002150 [Plasmodium coatneyi]|uniref:Uncharacterized protein n=1 Tax=Plasmodium coatneyi TaxID=208452 RepID=A0A1B1DSJ5_9APIC|nr:Uncharacterized protein PCOAH_00002150 [Plasmodium coatneyi]ANQ05766.1 Uncharacterized protein PCOAH_00002150 [Plasmodium coatneyi]